LQWANILESVHIRIIKLGILFAFAPILRVFIASCWGTVGNVNIVTIKAGQDPYFSIIFGVKCVPFYGFEKL
jgi:hypothetical protein